MEDSLSIIDSCTSYCNNLGFYHGNGLLPELMKRNLLNTTLTLPLAECGE